MIDKSAGSMQGIVVTHLTVIDFIGDSSDNSSETVKIASCGSPTLTESRLSEFHSVSDDHCNDDVGV